MRGHDPLADPGEMAALGVRVCELEEGFAGADAAIIMLNHPIYEEMDIASLLDSARKPTVVMDGWRLFNPEDMEQIPGVVYRWVGR